MSGEDECIEEFCCQRLHFYNLCILYSIVFVSCEILMALLTMLMTSVFTM